MRKRRVQVGEVLAPEEGLMETLVHLMKQREVLGGRAGTSGPPREILAPQRTFHTAVTPVRLLGGPVAT